MPTQTTGRPRARAFSAKTTGRRPLPASRPTGAEDRGSPTAAIVGPRCSVVAHAEVLLDAAQLAAHLRKLLDGHEDALLLAQGRGGGAEHVLAGRHVLGHARLG